MKTTHRIVMCSLCVGAVSLSPALVQSALGMTELQKVTIGSVMSALSSTNLVFSGITAGRGENTAHVSQNNADLSFSSKGIDAIGVQDLRFWGSIGGLRADGDFSGGGYDRTFGFGVGIGNAEVGVLHTLSDYQFNSGATSISTEGFQYGPYVNWEPGQGWEVQGMLMFGSHELTAVPHTDYETQRVSGALKVSKAFGFGSLLVEPFASVYATSEEHEAATIVVPVAARTISGMSSAGGVKVTYVDPHGIGQAYLSLAGEYTSYDDGLGASENNFAPRVGFGLESIGDIGTLRVYAETGERFDGNRDESIGMSLSIKF